MSTPRHYTVVCEKAPKGYKKLQVCPAFSTAMERAKQLAALGQVAAVYETDAEGRARRGDAPVYVARPKHDKPAAERKPKDKVAK